MEYNKNKNIKYYFVKLLFLRHKLINYYLKIITTSTYNSLGGMWK